MTLLDLSLLGLLADQPMHGYELSKRLRELGDGRAGVSFGSLYPALGRLDRQGLVTTDTAAGDGAARLPMTGSLGAEVASLRAGEAAPAPRGRRNRKVYAITDSGRERLRTLLAEPSDDDRAFALQLAFGRHLDAEQRLALLRRRHAELSQRIDSESPRLRDRYRRALRDRDRLASEAELVWLEHLIDEELGRLTDAPPESTPGNDAAPPQSQVPDPIVGGSPR